MDTINSLNIPRLDKIRLNLCRIYLHVLFLSDMTDAGGTQLLDTIMKGNRDDDRPSTLIWPVQGRPCEQDWKLWRYHISRIFARPRSRLLTRPLHRWSASSHQSWTWWYDPENNAAYHQQGDTYVRYIPDRQIRAITRSRSQWCTRINVVIGRPPGIMSKCTVQRQSANRILVQNVSRDDVLCRLLPH